MAIKSPYPRELRDRHFMEIQAWMLNHIRALGIASDHLADNNADAAAEVLDGATVELGRMIRKHVAEVGDSVPPAS